MAVRDFVHDEEIVEAVVAQLKAELPESWMKGENPLLRLKCCQVGDLRDYRLPSGTTYRDLCPALLVRLDRSEHTPGYGGLGGKEGQLVPLRLLHIRTREQCRNLANTDEIISPTRARAQCAKAISRALFANRNLGNPTLTTEDAEARVVELRPRGILYEADKADIALATTHDLVAFGIDFEVIVRTQ